MARKTAKNLIQETDNQVDIEQEHRELVAKKMAYFYSLIQFNGMDEEQAFKTVQENSYEQLAKISKVNVEKKMEDAANCVRKHMFKAFEYGVSGSFEEAVNGFYKDGRPVEKDLEDNFMNALGDGIYSYFEENGDVYDVILDIAEELHNKWVLENAMAFETEQIDENLFRHLPFELVGFNEVGESLLFVLPIMNRFRIACVGIGPSNVNNKVCISFSIEDRYIKRVNKFQAKIDMKSEEDFKNQLPSIIKAYESLDPKYAPRGQKKLFEKRLEYMLRPEKLEILKDEIEDQNPANYGDKFLLNKWGI